MFCDSPNPYVREGRAASGLRSRTLALPPLCLPQHSLVARSATPTSERLCSS